MSTGRRIQRNRQLGYVFSLGKKINVFILDLKFVIQGRRKVLRTYHHSLIAKRVWKLVYRKKSNQIEISQSTKVEKN